jgi:hypothetical protein
MQSGIKRTVTLIIALALIAVPCSVTAEDQFEDGQVKAIKMAADVVIARPVGMVSIAIGFGFFVISSPFSALGGNIGDAWHTLVASPAKFTFTRPLGQFE